MTHHGDSVHMTNEQYLEAKGNHCPACGGTDLYQNRDSVETGDGQATIWPSCTDCYASWRENYVLQSYDCLGIDT